MRTKDEKIELGKKPRMFLSQKHSLLFPTDVSFIMRHCENWASLWNNLRLVGEYLSIQVQPQIKPCDIFNQNSNVKIIIILTIFKVRPTLD